MKKLFFVFFISTSFYVNAQKVEEKVIIDIVKEMWLAMEKNDVDTYISYFDKDYTSFGEYTNILNVGRTTELESIKKSLSHITDLKTIMKDPIVRINNDVAWITYYWSDSGFYDEKPFATKGKSTRIFIKKQKKWLCTHSHFTLISE